MMNWSDVIDIISQYFNHINLEYKITEESLCCTVYLPESESGPRSRPSICVSISTIVEDWQTGLIWSNPVVLILIILISDIVVLRYTRINNNNKHNIFHFFYK